MSPGATLPAPLVGNLQVTVTDELPTRKCRPDSLWPGESVGGIGGRHHVGSAEHDDRRRWVGAKPCLGFRRTGQRVRIDEQQVAFHFCGRWPGRQRVRFLRLVSLPRANGADPVSRARGPKLGTFAALPGP